MQRDYKKEYQAETPLRRKQRSSRNKARRKMSALGRVSRGDGKDVDHRDGNPLNNGSGNLSVMSKSRNRSKR